MSITLGEIAEVIGAELHGDADCNITGVATLKNASDGDISFLANRRYGRYLPSTRASAVILSAIDKANCPVNALVIENPYLAYVKVVRYLHPEKPAEAGIHRRAVISSSATIAATATIGANACIDRDVHIEDGVYVGPGCVIGSNVVIGCSSRLVANVTLCHGVRIGKYTLLHPGVVIGADGFGIANDNGLWLKIPQIGSVHVGDNVEIGANTTIDRGALDNTVIEEGVKIDNQVQIGHNTRIGAHTAIAGGAMIAGSVTIGKRCMIAGATAITGHIEITDDVVITGMSGVSNSIKKPGTYSSGISIMDNKIWRKNVVRFKHLDELARRLEHLESLINKPD